MKSHPVVIPVLAAATLFALPDTAPAFHRSTATIVPITLTGDTDLARTPPQGRRAMALVLPDGAGKKVVSFSPHHTGSQESLVFSGGDNRNVAVAVSGKAFAWDTDADPLLSGAPGRQVLMNIKGALIQAAVDPTGTSANPSLDKTGRRVAFESTGDLAGTGNAGARQIFLREPTGTLLQMSVGQGESRNPMLSGRGKMLAFESTSDPATGADTGVSQIFAGRYDLPPIPRVTAGAGPSRNPTLSDDGRLVVFESEADLATGGAATGVPQIFAYDTRSATFAQLTFDAGGCRRPAASRVGQDWRIAFVCGGEAQFFMLRRGDRFRVQTPGGTVQSVVPGLGAHFVLLSTTANLLSGGTTAGNQVYMINLFTRPAEPIPGGAVWFPFQGIRPL